MNKRKQEIQAQIDEYTKWLAENPKGKNLKRLQKEYIRDCLEAELKSMEETNNKK